jgi:hypothetical protein
MASRLAVEEFLGLQGACPPRLQSMLGWAIRIAERENSYESTEDYCLHETQLRLE